MEVSARWLSSVSGRSLLSDSWYPAEFAIIAPCEGRSPPSGHRSREVTILQPYPRFNQFAPSERPGGVLWLGARRASRRTMSEPAERHEFQAEVRELLDL